MSTAVATTRVDARPRLDRLSIVVLVAGNALTIAIAVVQQWKLMLLLWPFFIQSVIIGWYSVRRILALKNFTTEGFKINGQQPPTTRGTQWMTAIFFTVHYGLFHVVYLFFLLLFTWGTPSELTPEQAAAAQVSWDELKWALFAGASFVVTHAVSFRRNLAYDRRGCPNIGTLMFLPYARVFPMHLMICMALPMGSGTGGILLFGALKTVADVVMHVVEHRVLARPAKSRTKS